MSNGATDADREKATIVVETGKNAGEEIPCGFNPTEYSQETSVTYDEQSPPGLTTPITQFVSGDAETLSMELLFDTTESGGDVREEYTDKLDALLAVDGELHAPPICRFIWGNDLNFKAVLQSANKRFTMFLSDGTPVRATVDVTFKKYDTPVHQKSDEPRSSPDKTKVRRVTEGESLWSIASREYGDPEQWRTIAQANGIENPRELQPGTELAIPPLKKQ